MPPTAFSIGPFNFHWYGLIVGSGILGALLVVKWRTQSYQVASSVIDRLFWLSLGIGILGSRLYHVLDYWDYYWQDPLRVFFIWEGGMAIYGGLLAGLVTVYVFAKKYHLSTLKLLDLGAPAVALGQSIGRWGNLVNLEGFGPPTNLAWGINIPESLRPEAFKNFERFHPTFLYESLATFLIFILLMTVSRKFQNKTGLVFALYVMLYSIVRFFIENYRLDTWVIGSFKVAQVISVFLFGYSLILLAKILKSND